MLDLASLTKQIKKVTRISNPIREKGHWVVNITVNGVSDKLHLTTEQGANEVVLHLKNLRRKSK